MRDEHVMDLLAAYALGATAGSECERVEAHVAECETCRAELEATRRDVALLGESTFETPPAHLRAKVLEHIDEEVAGVAATAPSLATMPPPVTQLKPRRERRRQLRTGIPLLTAACVLLLVAVGVQTFRVADLREDLNSAREQKPTPTLGVLADDTVSVKTSGSLADATGEVALTGDRGSAILLHEVPAPAVGKTWQVWAIDDKGRMMSMGLIEHAASTAVMAIPEGLRDSLDAIAITLEPEGGVKQPTSAPQAFGDLRA